MRRSSRKKQFFMINLGLTSLVVLVMDRIQFPQAETKPAYYKIQDLGLNKLPNALNDNAQVVGMMNSAKDSVQAFVWSRDTGFEYIGDDNSIASGINSSGEVVGHLGTTPGERVPFRWRKEEGSSPLDSSIKGEALAYGINSTGKVVGQIASEKGETLFQGFVCDNTAGTLLPLGTLGGRASQAAAINERGLVVGWAKTESDKSSHAFRWDEKIGMTDLGSLGGKNSYANAVNEEGVTVGSSETATGNFHAFLHRDGKMTDLGTLGGSWSLAGDINNQGWAVGQSDLPQSPRSLFEEKGRDLLERFVNVGSRDAVFHACIWKEEKIADLNDLVGDLGSWDVLSGATAINSKGQIAGYGLKDGRIHGFLLTPNESLPQSGAGGAQLAWAGDTR